MKTKLLAFVTAGAIATSGLTVTSAQAGPNDDLVKFLVGAAIIGAIASEANKAQKKQKVTRAPVHRPHRAQVQRPHRPQVQQPHRQVRVSYNKPNTCLRQRWTQNGWKTFYAKQCMITRGWERHDGIGWHKHN
jgi:hypothetical protein